MGENLYKVSEVAALFRVTDATVMKWAREGDLEAVKLPGGKGYRFHREVIEKALGATGSAALLTSGDTGDAA